LIIIS